MPQWEPSKPSWRRAACIPITQHIERLLEAGRDFVVLFQSDDWETRSRQALSDFNAAARAKRLAKALGGGLHRDTLQTRHPSPAGIPLPAN